MLELYKFEFFECNIPSKNTIGCLEIIPDVYFSAYIDTIEQLSSMLMDKLSNASNEDTICLVSKFFLQRCLAMVNILRQKYNESLWVALKTLLPDSSSIYNNIQIVCS